MILKNKLCIYWNLTMTRYILYILGIVLNLKEIVSWELLLTSNFTWDLALTTIKIKIYVYANKWIVYKNKSDKNRIWFFK